MGKIIDIATQRVDRNAPHLTEGALSPRAVIQAQALVTAIHTVGYPTVLEDERATLATYELLVQTRGRVSAATSHRYAVQIARFMEGLGTYRLPDGTVGPVTLFHLGIPGLGLQILLDWWTGLQDDEEVRGRVFGDAFRAMEQFFREYLCTPNAIADYRSLSRLGRGAAQQTGTLVLTTRYGTLVNPFLDFLRPGKKHRAWEPVPRYDEWLQILELLCTRQPEWLKTLPMRKAFPLLRTVAMLLLQSATGPRPSELCSVKQGHLLPDRLLILHGGEKDRLPKNRKYDLYGNRLGRYREVPLCYVPDELRQHVQRWLPLLAASGRIALEPERALFPSGLGRKENCVDYDTYRRSFKRILLDIADEPSVKAILGPYLVRDAPTAETWDLRLTPHTVRAIYATHRMDLCNTHGSFRKVMQHMGWISPTSVLPYDRPGREDPALIQDKILMAVREGGSA